jgi:hypothetical protein
VKHIGRRATLATALFVVGFVLGRTVPPAMLMLLVGTAAAAGAVTTVRGRRPTTPVTEVAEPVVELRRFDPPAKVYAVEVDETAAQYIETVLATDMGEIAAQPA